MKRTGYSLMTGLAVLLVAACAGREARDERSVYEAYAGEPVEAANFRNIRNWSLAGDNLVLLETRRREYYLVTLEPICRHDLAATQSLQLDRASNFRLRARFDHITLLDEDRRCRIEEIRPLDYEALQRDRE